MATSFAISRTGPTPKHSSIQQLTQATFTQAPYRLTTIRVKIFSGSGKIVVQKIAGDYSSVT